MTAFWNGFYVTLGIFAAFVFLFLMGLLFALGLVFIGVNIVT